MISPGGGSSHNSIVELDSMYVLQFSVSEKHFLQLDIYAIVSRLISVEVDYNNGQMKPMPSTAARTE